MSLLLLRRYGPAVNSNALYNFQNNNSTLYPSGVYPAGTGNSQGDCSLHMLRTIYADIVNIHFLAVIICGITFLYVICRIFDFTLQITINKNQGPGD
jgi:hypothetical protein